MNFVGALLVVFVINVVPSSGVGKFSQVIKIRDDAAMEKIKFVRNELVDGVDKLTEDIQSMIADILQKITNRYNNMQNKLNYMIHNVKTEIAHTIEKEADIMNNEFKDLVAEITDEDPTQCIAQHTHILSKAMETLTLESADCIESREVVVRKQLGIALNEVQLSIADAITIKDDIRECGTDLSAIACILKRATEDVSKTPKAILNQFYDLEEQVSRLLNEIWQCKHKVGLNLSEKVDTTDPIKLCGLVR